MIVLIFILKLILYLFILLLGLLTLLLVLPITYSGEVMFSGGVNASYHLGWPWKIFKVKGHYDDNGYAMGIYINNRRILKLSGNEADEEDKVKEEKEEKNDDSDEEEKEGKRTQGIKDFLDKRFINEVIIYIKKIIGILKPKYMHFTGVYGFEDPSITGMLCGAISAINSCIPKYKLQVYPDFTQEILDIDFKAEGRITLGSLAYHTLRTVLKKEVRKKIFKKRK